MSVTPDGKLKINVDGWFTNTAYHSSTGQMMSMPPEAEELHEWTRKISEKLRDMVQKTMQGLGLGEFKDAEILYRFCW